MLVVVQNTKTFNKGDEASFHIFNRDMQMRTWFLRRRSVVFFVGILALFVAGLFAIMYTISSKADKPGFRSKLVSVQDIQGIFGKLKDNFTPTSAEPQLKPAQNKNARLVVGEDERRALNEPADDVLSNYNVHTFYYAWYGNPEFDERYIHWNHKYILHWNAHVAKFQKKGQHSPPDDIGANFYPELGAYSSRDPRVINDHMRQIKGAGIGVLVLSWYPPSKSDDNGIPVDGLVPAILDAAKKHKLKVTFHIEPYKDRNDLTVHDDVKYIIDQYGKHEAFYRHTVKDGRSLPMLYVYDSYHTSPEDWAQLLTARGLHSIRHTPYDCVFIALMVEMSHRQYVELGGFDGFYTYFAVDSFTYGSSWRFWSQLQAFAKQAGAIFIPSVGPGYIDTNVRPWNNENTRSRANGEYYKRSWKAAFLVKPEIVSITSFNEWHEGTQIEKAVPKSAIGVEYKDYTPQGSDFYLQLTKQFVEQFAVERKSKL